MAVPEGAQGVPGALPPEAEVPGLQTDAPTPAGLHPNLGCWQGGRRIGSNNKQLPASAFEGFPSNVFPPLAFNMAHGVRGRCQGRESCPSSYVKEKINS